MQKFYLENLRLKVTINQMGAEISSVLSKENGFEYVWSGDEKYWKRQAPVLFPIVGSLKNGSFVVDGENYPMSQHGFARDMDFKMVKQANGKEILFRLDYNEETLKKYPYKFALEIRYILEGYKLTTNWKVINLDDKDIHFQIGGHPAFMCPLGKGKQSEYFFNFDIDKDIEYSLLSSNGLVESEGNVLKNDGGLVAIDEHMFDKDALIIEKSGINKVELCKPDGMSYLAVGFEAPVFGLWSPAGKQAPFICIEPWYGRADKESFSGEISDREYDNKIAPGEAFEASYYIEIEM